MQLNKNIYESVVEVVAALKLQGFAAPNRLLEGEENTLETELFKSVLKIANDSCASGTHFFTVPAVHRFYDGSEIHISVNLLYNKEATILNIHSIQAQSGNIHERSLPNETEDPGGSLHSGVLTRTQSSNTKYAGTIGDSNRKKALTV